MANFCLTAARIELFIQRCWCIFTIFRMLGFITCQKLPNVADHQRNFTCFACVTPNVDLLRRYLVDTDWQRYLRNLHAVPRTIGCERRDEVLEYSEQEVSPLVVAGEVALQGCTGLCVKVQLQHYGGQVYMFRHCLNKPDSRRAGCTTISNDRGRMDLCYCRGDNCNPAATLQANDALNQSLIIICFLVFMTLF